MKKIIKLFVLSASLLLVLATTAIAMFALLFDPNNLRDGITRAVEQKTGRQLIIEGDLSLTYFPWLGFEVGRTTLSNPQGFSDKLMATVESASASVKLIPLLKRQMELSKATFNGVDLKLEILANGSDNWTDLIGSPAPATADGSDNGGSFAARGVNGIHLGNTRISYTNAQSGDAYHVSKLQLETGVVAAGKPFSLTASADVSSERDGFSGPASIAAEVQFGNSNTIYLRQADMQINATGNTIPGDQLLLKMQSPVLEAHPKKITIETPQIQFSGNGNGNPWASIEGQASAQSLAMVLEEETITVTRPVMQLKATSTNNLWTTLDGKLNGQSLLLQMEQDKNSITIATPVMQLSGTSSGNSWATLNGTLNGPSMQLVSESGTNMVAIDTPVVQLKGTSTNDVWKTLDGKLNAQSLLLQIEQDKNSIAIAAPVMQISSTSAGSTWATLNGTLNGPSMRLVSEKANDKVTDTLTIDAPIMKLSSTATSGSWSALESSGKGQTLMLQIVEDTNTLTIGAPDFKLAGTGPGDPWSAIKGNAKGQSLKLVNYDLVDVPAMQVSGRITGKDLPGGYVDMTMTSERLQGSIEQENFAIDVARADLLDLSVFSKKIKASSVIEAPQFEAAIQVGKFSPAKLMRNLGYDTIVTADKTALSSATISGNAFYGPEWMEISNMVGTVDQTSLTGSVKVMTSGETRFNIAADAINLDRYRSPSQSTAAKPGVATAVTDIEIPTLSLRELALNGTLKVGKLQLAGLHSSDSEFTIRAAGGDIRIQPAQAKLYGGTYQGDIHINAKGKVPLLSLNERFEGVQFGPFTEDLLGRKRLTGTLSGRMTLVGSGATSSQIIGSSNGDAVFKFVDGAYLGVDFWHKVRSARALVKRETQPTEPASDRTPFGDLNGTAKIVNGVLRTDDLQAIMPNMEIRGSGNLVLLTQSVDFKFVGDVFNRPNLTAGDNELVGYPLPIKMTGTTAAPQIGVDMGSLLAELAKRKLLGKFGSGAGTTPEPNTDPNAQPAAAPTPAEKVQDIRQQAEDKIKDKLKGLLGGSEVKKSPDTETLAR